MSGKDFEGKAAIVTGGSSGIGATIVARLVEKGATVMAIGTNAAKLDAVAERVGSRVRPYVADVGEREQIETAVRVAVEEFGGLDLLVNNAGIGGPLARAGEVVPTDWARVLDVNLNSIFWAVRVALPHLIARRGCIVNTASLAAFGADYSFATYNVSKAAVVALTRSIAVDYARDGVRVNSVSPGFVRTPLNEDLPEVMAEAFIAATPMQRAGSTEEVADAVIFLASAQSAFITGQNLAIDGGTIARNPLPDVPALVQNL